MSTPHTSFAASNLSASTPAYTDLLTTISSLQLDLQKTVKLCSDLKRENSVVVDSYGKVKVALVQTRTRYNETRSALLEQQVEVDERDARVEGLVNKWKGMVDDKSKDLVELQEKLAPQDLDLLRIKLQDEVAQTHKVKLVGMDKEIGKWRNMFFQVRREYELVRTELGEFRVSTERDLEDGVLRRVKEVEGLNRAVVKLQNELSSSTSASGGEEIVRLQRQLKERGICEEELRNENAVLEEKFRKEVGERQEYVSGLQSERAELHGRLSMLEADNVKLLGKVGVLENSNATLKTAKAESDLLADSARQDSGRARRVLAEREKEVSEEKSLGREEVVKGRRLFDLEREELQVRVAQAASEASRAQERKTGGREHAVENGRSRTGGREHAVENRLSQESRWVTGSESSICSGGAQLRAFPCQSAQLLAPGAF